MMHALPNRRLRSFLFLSLAFVTFLVFFHSDDENGLAYLTPQLSNSEEPQALDNDVEQGPVTGGYPYVPPKLRHKSTQSATSPPTHVAEPTVKASGPTSTATEPTQQVTGHQDYNTQRTAGASASSSQATSDPSSGAIVAAVGLNTNLSWISEIKNPIWTLHRYNHDDLSPLPNASFPTNKGNEAMMYLSYVINNYDSLPEYSVFIHGHRLSWHQEGDMVDMINNLRFPALENAEYVPLRCDWYPSCPREIRPIDRDAVEWGPAVQRNETEEAIGQVWKSLFPEEELPETIASQCCAQFVVTKNAILSRTKEEYERMREWLIQTELINDVSGRVFEKLWAYIFTKDAIRCPPPQQCACDYFGQCELKAWPVPPVGLAKWPDEFDHYGLESK